jgi:polyhydroxyalkanoate synthesis regulator phasin
MITFIPPADAKDKLGAIATAKAGFAASMVKSKVNETIDELYSKGIVLVELYDSPQVRQVQQALANGKKISINA